MLTMKIKFFRDRADGGYEECERDIPAKSCVCPDCRGKGRHLTNSLRDVSFTREDFDEDPDFAESYMNGTYDVTCRTCGGAKVSVEPDLDRFTPEDKEAYDLYVEGQRQLHLMRLEQESERRMGA